MQSETGLDQETLTTCGYELSWDNEAHAGFLCVEHGQDAEGNPMCAWSSRRTVELGEGDTMIDIDQDGRIRGVETIGHRVGFNDLVRVIRWANDQRAGQEGGRAE